MKKYKELMNENEKAIAIITKLVMENNDITLDDAIKKVSGLINCSDGYVKDMWRFHYLDN